VHEEKFQFLYFFIRSGSVMYIFVNKNTFGLQGQRTLHEPILKVFTHRNFKFVDESESELDIEYPKLDNEYPNSNFGEEGEEDVNDDGYDKDVNSIKHVYRDCTWHQNFITYEP